MRRRLVYKSTSDYWHTEAVIAALDDHFMSEAVHDLHTDPNRYSSQLYLDCVDPDFLFTNKYEREGVGTYIGYVNMDHFYLFLNTEATA